MAGDWKLKKDGGKVLKDKDFGGSANEALIEADRDATTARYSYIFYLVQKYPELQGFLDEVTSTINNSATGVITEAEVAQITKRYDYFTRLDSEQQASENQMAEDALNNTSIYEDSIQGLRSKIGADALSKGITLDEDQLDKLARLAKYENFTPDEINTSLRGVAQIDGTKDLTGTAGDYLQALSQWSAKNGLQIPPDSLNRLLTAGAFGDQTLEDMKAELRVKYLAGSFPGWEKEIRAGADPYDLAAPYRATLANMLELSEQDISFDDDLLSQAMQSNMTITDLKREARKDPRWDKTENALKAATDAGSNILTMFGLR